MIHQATLFMPTTPFREGYVCNLFGQVFWLSDRPEPAPSRRAGKRGQEPIVHSTLRAILAIGS